MWEVGSGECQRLCVEKQVFVRKGQTFCKEHRMLLVHQQKELLDEAPLKSGPLREPDRLTLRSPVVFPLASGEVVCALGKSGPPSVPFRLTLRLVFGVLLTGGPGFLHWDDCVVCVVCVFVYV
jgi:NAD-dependent dihydropyrimidine dehydrogenase PreA subunit